MSKKAGRDRCQTWRVSRHRPGGRRRPQPPLRAGTTMDEACGIRCLEGRVEAPGARPVRVGPATPGQRCRCAGQRERLRCTGRRLDEDQHARGISPGEARGDDADTDRNSYCRRARGDPRRHGGADSAHVEAATRPHVVRPYPISDTDNSDHNPALAHWTFQNNCPYPVYWIVQCGLAHRLMRFCKRVKSGRK
jgi:hypothetical protein